jgi:PleD family two-component response regulator
VFIEKAASKEHIIQMADQLMYQSKIEGRNRITLATLG